VTLLIYQPIGNAPLSSPRRQVGNDRLIRILEKIPVFAGLGDDEYEALLTVCNVIQFRDGDIIFREGDIGSDLFILLSGQVEVNTRWGGLIHSLKSGEILGEVAMVSDMHRTAGAVARGDIFLLRLAREALDGLVPRHPHLGYTVMKNIARALAERLAVTNQRASGVLELSSPLPTSDDGLYPDA